LDTIERGQKLVVYRPGDWSSVRRYTVGYPSAYHDDDGTMMIDLIGADGKPHAMPTSEAGLTCERYSGDWLFVAIPDEQ